MNGNRFKNIFSRTIKFSDSFFPSCIVDWNELDEKLKKVINKKSFYSSLVKLVRPPNRKNVKILDKIALKYLPQLRVWLNDLTRYKFDHNFDDTIDPMRSANDGVEDVTHFLLSCQLYGHIRIELLNSVSRISGTNVNDLDKQALVKLLLFGNEYKYSFVIRILFSTVTFIRKEQSFLKACSTKASFVFLFVFLKLILLNCL